MISIFSSDLNVFVYVDCILVFVLQKWCHTPRVHTLIFNIDPCHEIISDSSVSQPSCHYFPLRNLFNATMRYEYHPSYCVSVYMLPSFGELKIIVIAKISFCDFSRTSVYPLCQCLYPFYISLWYLIIRECGNTYIQSDTSYCVEIKDYFQVLLYTCYSRLFIYVQDISFIQKNETFIFNL